MVAEIFVTSGHAKNPLRDHDIEFVTNLFRCSGFINHGGQAVRQTMLFIDFP